MSEAEYAQGAQERKRKRGWIAVTVVLFILALPVLIPVVLGAGALAVGILLAAAACAVTVILGAGGCAAAAAVCLAVLLFGGIIGAGLGLGILFSAPGSGLAVLGANLIALGVGVLGVLLFWQLGRLLVRAVRKAAGWLGRRFLERRKKRPQESAAAEQEAGGYEA